MTALRNTLKFTIAAPLALALAACGGDAGDGDLEGDEIAAIEAPDGTDWLDTVTVSEDGQGFMVGNPDAPLKLTEYASHTCGACANFAQTGKEPLKEYVKTGVVSFEQREVFLSPLDAVVATIVQCGTPGQFQALSDEMWQNFQPVMANAYADQAGLQAANDLPPEQKYIAFGEITGLTDFFAARGISADQARSCLSDVEKINAMDKLVRENAAAVPVTGTPTFVLNGRKLDALSWTDLEATLQRAGARKE